MLQKTATLLRAEGISLFAPVPLSACEITKKYLLSREGITNGTAIMIAVPYYSADSERRHRARLSENDLQIRRIYFSEILREARGASDRKAP